MGAAALSRREFCEFIDVSNRELTAGYGYGPFRPRALSPVSHARGRVVRMRQSPARTRRVSLNVSRESSRLMVEGIRNNT
jgi:hypothetical protein